MDEEAKDKTKPGKADKGKKKEEVKSFSVQEYCDVAAKLVHFNAKTVNTNAASVGLRLGPGSAVDLPYVSARTLMAREVYIPLDWAGNLGTQSDTFKNIRAVLEHNEAEAELPEEEKEKIRQALQQERTLRTTYATGENFVDHRLRQILIPKEGEEGGYVALTPITAGGVCALLFGRGGLVDRHNKEYNEARKNNTDSATLKFLRQAHLGIGGSNAQNVGPLVHTMQDPLFLDAPGASVSLKTAFSWYYKGVPLDFSAPGPLRDALKSYLDFRSQLGLDQAEEAEKKTWSAVKKTNLQARSEEERLIGNIADVVLDLAEEARKTLEEYRAALPQESDAAGRFCLCSPKLPLAMRGLLDLASRDAGWPREMAQTVLAAMRRAKRGTQSLLILDPVAESTVANLLEEAFR